MAQLPALPTNSIQLPRLSVTISEVPTTNSAGTAGCIEPGPDGGIVVLDDTTIYDMAVEILQEEEKKKEK